MAEASDRPPFVDAHVHFWDRDRLRYPWLDAPAHAPIAGRYLPADYRREVAAWNLAGCVHVEAGAHPDDAAAETAWLEELADRDGLPTAIVAQVALDNPDLDDTLARLAARPRVRGVRHIVNWHPTDVARRAVPHDLTRDPRWRQGYARLAAYGLSYDFHGFPPQLAGLAEVAAAHPEVPLILDHLALPIPADGLAEWRAGIAALAALPQAAIKLSGAGFIATPFDAARIAEVVTEVIDRFGTGRVMVASNLSTDRLFAGLDETFATYQSILAGCSIDERRDLWGRNAARVYRLDLDL